MLVGTRLWCTVMVMGLPWLWLSLVLLVMEMYGTNTFLFPFHFIFYFKNPSLQLRTFPDYVEAASIPENKDQDLSPILHPS